MHKSSEFTVLLQDFEEWGWALGQGGEGGGWYGAASSPLHYHTPKVLVTSCHWDFEYLPRLG